MTSSNPSAIETRLALALPMPAWLAGLSIAIVLTTIGLALHALGGVALFTGAESKTPRMTPQTHVTILCSTLIAYGLAAARWVTEPGRHLDAPTQIDWQFSRLAGVVGAIVGVVVIVLTKRQIGIQEPDRNPWSMGELYVDLLSVLLLWGIGRAVYFTVRSAGGLGRDGPVVDLWNMTALYGYGSQGMRKALAWSVGISLLVLIMFFDPNPGLQVDSIRLLGLVTVTAVATAALSLFRPLWTVRRCIRREKSRAIDSIDAQLRSMRRDESRGIATVPGVEADLLARRKFVNDCAEWPIDTGTLRKLGFYALFPAITWFVGPVLRRIIENFFFEQIVHKVLE